MQVSVITDERKTEAKMTSTRHQQF